MDKIRKFEPFFGEWYAESFIGAGSFGRVYRIFREEHGNRVYSALKYISIPAEKSEIDQLRSDGMDDASISNYYTDLVRDISAEITLMDELRGNANIVNFEDSQILPKSGGIGYDVFIRMELLQSLTERMIKSPLSCAETVKLGKDLCSALDSCKEKGIIHRDVKPDNIFVSQTGEFKLGDFGIARQLEKTATFMSRKGTFNYMAPEVYKGEKYGATCDQYSLGLVMYRLLNRGRLPFLPEAPKPITAGDRETALQRRFKGEPIPAPCDADNELSEIVLAACAFDPKHRFASANAMGKALAEYSCGEAADTPEHDIKRANDDSNKEQGRSDDPDATVSVRSIQDNTELIPAASGVRTTSKANTEYHGSNTAHDSARAQNSKTGERSLKDHDGGKTSKKRLAKILGIAAALTAAAVLIIVLIQSHKKSEEQNQYVNNGYTNSGGQDGSLEGVGVIEDSTDEPEITPAPLTPEPITPAPVTAVPATPAPNYQEIWMRFLNAKSWRSAVGDANSNWYNGENHDVQYLIRDFDSDGIPEMVVLEHVEYFSEQYNNSLSVWKYDPGSNSEYYIFLTTDLPSYAEQKLCYSARYNAFIRINKAAGGWDYDYYTVQNGGVVKLFTILEEWEGEDAGVWINDANGVHEITYEQRAEYVEEQSDANIISVSG